MPFWAVSKLPHLTALLGFMPCPLFYSAQTLVTSPGPEFYMLISSTYWCLAILSFCPIILPRFIIQWSHPSSHQQHRPHSYSFFLELHTPTFLLLGSVHSAVVAQSIYKVLRLEAMSYVSFGSGLLLMIKLVVIEIASKETLVCNMNSTEESSLQCKADLDSLGPIQSLNFPLCTCSRSKWFFWSPVYDTSTNNGDKMVALHIVECFTNPMCKASWQVL